MAVLIEALNVIVKESALLDQPGIKATFQNNIPSTAYCSDGLIHRVGFMSPDRVGEYVFFLESQLGLHLFDKSGKARDVIVVDMIQGPTISCDWINFRRDRFFSHRTEYSKSQENFSIAWHTDLFSGYTNKYEVFTPEGGGDHEFFEPGISFPFGWNPDKGLYTSNFEQEPDVLEEIERTDKIITYIHKVTGELRYVGIPNIPDNEPFVTDDSSQIKESAIQMPRKSRNWLQKLFNVLGST